MQQLLRIHLVLLHVGFTLLVSILLPLSALFQWIMNQLVSVVWAELHPQTYAALQMLFVYGVSAAFVYIFMKKIQINKRLQPNYASSRLWFVGCALFIVVLITNILIAADAISLLASDRQLLVYILTAAKIILLTAGVRVLIGILPRASS